MAQRKPVSNGRKTAKKSATKNGVEKTTPSLSDPGPMDFDKAKEAVRRIMDENEEWLKQMANR